MLTYANPPPVGDNRYHEVRVEVKRRDLVVQERSGYTDYPFDDLEERTLSGALNLPGTVGVPLVAWALRTWSPAGDPVVSVALQAPEAIGTETLEFELHGLAIRSDGEPESTVGQRIRQAFGETPYPVYLYEWDLQPGSYDLRLVVRNGLSRQLSATTLPVEVPTPTPGWATSDLVLTVADGAGRQFPVMGDALVEDDEVAAYVEVVFGQTPVVSGAVFNGEGTEKIVDLPATAMERSAEGIFRGTLRMTGMPAGEYSLQVAVTDTAARQHRVFRRLLRVRER